MPPMPAMRSTAPAFPQGLGSQSQGALGARRPSGRYGLVHTAATQSGAAHAGGGALRVRCGYAQEVVGTGDEASFEGLGRQGNTGNWG